MCVEANKHVCRASGTAQLLFETVFYFYSITVSHTMAKGNLGSRGLIWLILPAILILTGSQDRSSKQTMEECCLLVR